MARATTGIAYLAFGLVLLGGLVFVVFVTLPAWSALGGTRDQLAQRSVERDGRKEFLANVDARSQELKAYERHARALGVTFPETKAPGDLAAIVHALATRNGVIVESLAEPRVRTTRVEPSPVPASTANEEGTTPSGQEEQSSKVSSVPVRLPAYEYTLTARGTYAQLRAFIGDLERSPRLFDVPTVEITGSSRPEDAASVKARMTFVTYLAES